MNIKTFGCLVYTTVLPSSRNTFTYHVIPLIFVVILYATKNTNCIPYKPNIFFSRDVLFNFFF